MSFRLLPLAAALVASTALPAAAQLSCVNPAADPCVIDATANIAVGVYDIRPKSLTVGNKLFTLTGGPGTVHILANDIIFQPGARFVANHTAGLVAVTLEATGAIDLQSQGTSRSRIETSGSGTAGAITLVSGGDLTSNATLLANASSQFGFAGAISLLSMTGNVSVGGEGIKASGEQQGGGGTISLDAILGSVTVSALLEAKNGDCSGCEVSISADGDVTTTAQGDVDMRASGIGDGGTFNVLAGGNIALAGDILANGSQDEFEGGAGGELDVDAGGALVVGGRIEINGAGQGASPGSETGSVDGDGGGAAFAAGTTLQLNAPLFAVSKGFGSTDGAEFDAFGNVTIAAEVDYTGDEFGGDVSVISDALVTVSARVRTSSIVDLVNHPFALGGSVDIQACQINVTATGELVSSGSDSGSNYLWASTGLTVAGKLTAKTENELMWRTTAPVLTGQIVPAATVVQNMLLPCCGEQCPATTTSTSTSSSTSTTSTSSASSSSTSTPSTSTTSTTGPGPTTTSSTTSIVPTTSSSSTAPTTSTTGATIPTTTSTSSMPGSTSSTSTAAPTTTIVPGTTSTSSTTVLATTTTTVSSSSTLAPTTSSTSVTPSTTSSTTTTVPLTCLDTALGIDAVRCRLDFLNGLVTGATESDLGGRKLAKAIARHVAKATSLAGEPVKPKRLKKAAKQLKQLAAKVGKGVAAGKLDATLGAGLQTLATEAQSELTALVTP
jgi:hypothetical protein